MDVDVGRQFSPIHGDDHRLFPSGGQAHRQAPVDAPIAGLEPPAFVREASHVVVVRRIEVRRPSERKLIIGGWDVDHDRDALHPHRVRHVQRRGVCADRRVDRYGYVHFPGCVSVSCWQREVQAVNPVDIAGHPHLDPWEGLQLVVVELQVDINPCHTQDRPELSEQTVMDSLHRVLDHYLLVVAVLVVLVQPEELVRLHDTVMVQVDPVVQEEIVLDIRHIVLVRIKRRK